MSGLCISPPLLYIVASASVWGSKGCHGYLAGHSLFWECCPSLGTDLGIFIWLMSSTRLEPAPEAINTVLFLKFESTAQLFPAHLTRIRQVLSLHAVQPNHVVAVGSWRHHGHGWGCVDVLSTWLQFLTIEEGVTKPLSACPGQFVCCWMISYRNHPNKLWMALGLCCFWFTSISITEISNLNYCACFFWVLRLGESWSIMF